MTLPRTPDDAWLEELWTLARKLAYVRPMGRYPGWHHAIGEDDPDPAVQARREIWRYCNSNLLETPFEYNWWEGLRLNLYLGNDVSRLLFIGGCSDPNEFALLDKFLQPGMVVVDVGANEGLYTAFAARRVGAGGAVLAFEPSSREFARLEKNVELNGLANVKLYRMALFGSDQELELQVAGYEHENLNTLGRFAYPGVEGCGTERVTARRLDGLIAESGLSRVDFVKIDVEGSETRVIEGARTVLQKFRPLILFEALEPALLAQGTSREELWNALRACGYRLYGFDSEGLPVPAEQRSSENMLAAPVEKPLPQEWCGAPDVRMATNPKRKAVPAEPPYLSIVVTTRNDDHGGGLLPRTQTFVNALIGQCKRHGVAAELIMVEWNPPPDRPPLREALHWPAVTGPCQIRFVEVPEPLHARFRHAGVLPLLQMIGKNAGIRRARGKFILATNIDILFSDELMHFLAQEKLQPGRMYRIDRHDVMVDVPVDAPVEEQLAYCQTHHLRVYAREGIFPLTADGDLAPLEHDIVSPDSGITLGNGWFGLEWEGKSPHRAVGDMAELRVSPMEKARSLYLEVEPGPGVRGRSCALRITDEAGALFAEIEIDGRSEVVIQLPPHSGTRGFRLGAVQGGIPTPDDLRIVNFRVFRCGWREQARAPARHNLSPEMGMAPEQSLVPEPNVTPIKAKPVSPAKGVPQKLLGVLHRAAENGPAIPVWVPIPRWVRRFLRFCFRTVEQPAASPLPPVASESAMAAHEVESAAQSLVMEPMESGRTAEFLHTNACGDFTLLAKEDWFALRGYPEWDFYSFHIDSVFCYAAHYGGVREYMLEKPMKIYHIEHGGGWSPESADQLFQRLRAKGIPCLAYTELARMVWQMRLLDNPMIFNLANWGLRQHELQETDLEPLAGHANVEDS